MSAIEKITNPDFKPKQQLVGATRIFKARNAADGEINWLLTATEIVNLIRAVAFPYPGAFTHLGFKKIVIWKASVVKTSHTHPSGTIVSGTDKEFVVVCGVGSLKVSCWTLDGVDEFPKSCVLQKLESPALSRDGTVAHYESLLDLHGDSFKTLDWGSQAGQNKRFQVLACIAPLSGCRLLDVGCGLGHLANWLKDHAADYYSYTGIDIVPGLLAMAKKRHPSKCFILADISDESVLIDEKFDYVFASGIFYTYSSAAEGFLKRCVESMWKRATKGVAFNALSSKTVDKVNEEYYADVDSVLEFCKSLSPNVELIEGYHPRDFTIYMKRSAS